MDGNMTFQEVIAMAHDFEHGLTARGVDGVFDVLEHLATGGTVHNMGKYSYEEIIVMLAVSWVELRDAVNSRA